ncbi:related to flavin-binding monooxygenase [Ramularia collo-cygni]|uniref:Related to flavin-binding monooxygenase n=1 Tax=Ramularia collo-cygni TaxID=112498 RepID=A0A2D3UQ74_9PEZI|nr:related to flavin-binding monooxygenase [Ramularia collo-cygni]CZT16318.1 related to flavin-binding monooxygenase [Ramularia collo-cygni]
MAGTQQEIDVAVIGAGLSGINAGYRIQEALPNYSYTIFESRHELGGTWSLFKYPGIRSDSDLYTFGFQFDPWREDKSIAPAPMILDYLQGVANRHGIDKHIKYHHAVESLDWSSELQKWKININVDGKENKVFWARFVIMSTGYYDYKKALPAEIPGIEQFKGEVVHPQFWPEDLAYADKKVVIVGSGATAVTLLPAMHETGAAHVTMLQRSPGYFINLPTANTINNILRSVLPASWAHSLIRLRTLTLTYAFYYFCRAFPGSAKRLLRKATERELPPNIPVDPHFTPKYNPWDQRMCVTPNGDFFAALRSGKASVATGHIEEVTAEGIILKSGEYIPADVIVTATGLKVQMCGNATLSVDGERVIVGDKYLWRGSMLQDVPNLAFFLGYTNASWTLGSDATARLFVRIVKQMERKGMTSTTPLMGDSETDNQKPPDMEALNLNSTYIKKAVMDGQFPMNLDANPWRARRNYFSDSWFASFGDVGKGLRFDRVSV